MFSLGSTMENMSQSLTSMDSKIEVLESRIEERLKNYLNKSLQRCKSDIVESLKSNSNSNKSFDVHTVNAQRMTQDASKFSIF